MFNLRMQGIRENIQYRRNLGASCKDFCGGQKTRN